MDEYVMKGRYDIEAHADEIVGSYEAETVGMSESDREAIRHAVLNDLRRTFDAALEEAATYIEHVHCGDVAPHEVAETVRGLKHAVKP